MRLAALLALLAAPALAQDDFLVTDGKLSPEDFYGVVSCRAAPGGPCAFDPVRWPDRLARSLRVGFAPVPAEYPRDQMRRMSAALDAAIAEINAAGAALTLSRAGKNEPREITVHLAPVRDGERIRGTGVAGVDGAVIGAALVTVWWDEAMDLTHAVIVMAEDLPPADVGPVMLEELAQATGLMTDIRNPVYEGVSVFSEDSNSAARLGPMDVDALRRHYPGPPA